VSPGADREIFGEDERVNVVVLVKNALVPELRPKIKADGKDFEKQDLVFEMNDWDGYALEEAIRIKEQKGGEVLALSVGEDCDKTLRGCLAMGADRAINIPFNSMDSWQIAELVGEVIRAENFDLILTGFQSQDLNNALVGPILAGMLGLPYATAVNLIQFEDRGLRIRRELEAGFQEEDTLPLPCLLTVQTGINRPRYPSTRAIIRARTQEIKKVSVTPKSATFEIQKLYFPTVTRGEMIEGLPEAVSLQFIEILKGKGLL
jgi:electron transfer flavoprotein beta subunit